MNPLAIAKLVGIGLVIALVVGGAFMLRHELIEKGKAYVYAEDNAALAKAQKAQLATDAALVKDQKAYIDHLELSGATVKEKIRVVQGPCKDDGAGDPRFGTFNEWMRSRSPAAAVPPDDRPAPQGAVPKAGK